MEKLGSLSAADGVQRQPRFENANTFGGQAGEVSYGESYGAVSIASSTIKTVESRRLGRLLEVEHDDDFH